MDFLRITKRVNKNGIELQPSFKVGAVKDLMIKGGKFYAVWDEENEIWSKDENRAIAMIDNELIKAANEYKKQFADVDIRILYMSDGDTKMIDKWKHYCSSQLIDSYHSLDEKVAYSNSKKSREEYSSKRLHYPLEPGETPAYNKLVSTLYDDEQRHKFEWAVGSVVNGASKDIQKFIVFYGEGGTGKSTILNIIEELFEGKDGYVAYFNAKAIGQSSNQFALEPFKDNPLVAIEHDSKLSKIEDNTRLNSLVSHEYLTVNEKNKNLYSMKFNAFLFMGSNSPVHITDARSGLLRRLIDVKPTGKKVPVHEYNMLKKQIKFELGAIAWHCKQVYEADPNYYDDYIPVSMMMASNDFYDFVISCYHIFKKDDGTSLNDAWARYKGYCEDSGARCMKRIEFAEELKAYFREYHDRYTDTADGKRVRSMYTGFRTERFEVESRGRGRKPDIKPKFIDISDTESILDVLYADCFAQYADEEGKPEKAWKYVKTTLADLDTSKLHYVLVPNKTHIVIDFDLKDENGNKSLEKNLEAASEWPKTYAEFSKSGCGIHLHYIYDGDPDELSPVYSPGIEVKVFNGLSALRRCLTKCMNVQIAHIGSILPKRKEKKVYTEASLESDKHLIALVKKALNKEIPPHATKPCMDFIKKITDDAYKQGLSYDISEMYDVIIGFAMQSTHQAGKCLEIANSIHYCSEEFKVDSKEVREDSLIFYDVEVFPNLLLICWKKYGEKAVHRMFNPSPGEVEEFCKLPLVGFNCRRYDNHIIWGRALGLDIEGIYNLSQSIISGNRNAFFGNAYNISYTDVYDFAAKKQSLKKWEIELGIHHKELGLPWDMPVDQSMWNLVAEYCDNDVIATEQVFLHLKGDFLARKILAAVAGGIPNDTTNSLTTKIIFGKERKPRLIYTDLASGISYDADDNPIDIHTGVINAFPGYAMVYDSEVKKNKNMYRNEDVGFGGYVYANPGMYSDVITFDVASMHPHSVLAMKCFGNYTENFEDILNVRMAIKHGDLDKAATLMDGKLKPFLTDADSADALAYALKIAINSVYGLTAANFENPFRDIRNKNNIVALRGALFMVNLKHEVERRGFRVVHIKTDSIKIERPNEEICDFVLSYGKSYGYDFEIEDKFEKICLVNNAVYIAKVAKDDPGWIKACKKAQEKGKPIPTRWHPTGAQFAVPYVFKTLFSHEDLVFSDYCNTFETKAGDLYLDFNEQLADVSQYEKELEKCEKQFKKGKITEEEFKLYSEELNEKIAEGHALSYVGRIGSFVPVKANCGGGILYRVKDGKRYAAPGTTGYRWVEAELLDESYPNIDISFFNSLAADAVDSISEFGNFEWFVSDDDGPEFNYIPENSPEELPWD